MGGEMTWCKLSSHDYVIRHPGPQKLKRYGIVYEFEFLQTYDGVGMIAEEIELIRSRVTASHRALKIWSVESFALNEKAKPLEICPSIAHLMISLMCRHCKSRHDRTADWAALTDGHDILFISPVGIMLYSTVLSRHQMILRALFIKSRQLHRDEAVGMIMMMVPLVTIFVGSRRTISDVVGRNIAILHFPRLQSTILPSEHTLDVPFRSRRRVCGLTRHLDHVRNCKVHQGQIPATLLGVQLAELGQEDVMHQLLGNDIVGVGEGE